MSYMRISSEWRHIDDVPGCRIRVRCVVQGARSWWEWELEVSANDPVNWAERVRAVADTEAEAVKVAREIGRFS